MRDQDAAEQIFAVQPLGEKDPARARPPISEPERSPTPDLIQPALSQLCGRFIGWDLLPDARTLVRWGSGEIILDLLQGSCRHNLRWQPPLMIAARLRAAFRNVLSQSELATERVRVAELRARMTLTPQRGSKISTIMWSIGGDDFVACRMLIEARVVTAERQASVRHEGRLEWPREWSG